MNIIAVEPDINQRTADIVSAEWLLAPQLPPLLLIRPTAEAKQGDHIVDDGTVYRLIPNHNGQRNTVQYIGRLEALEAHYIIQISAMGA